MEKNITIYTRKKTAFVRRICSNQTMDNRFASQFENLLWNFSLKLYIDLRCSFRCTEFMKPFKFNCAISFNKNCSASSNILSRFEWNIHEKMSELVHNTGTVPHITMWDAATTGCLFTHVQKSKNNEFVMGRCHLQHASSTKKLSISLPHCRSMLFLRSFIHFLPFALNGWGQNKNALTTIARAIFIVSDDLWTFRVNESGNLSGF